MITGKKVLVIAIFALLLATTAYIFYLDSKWEYISLDSNFTTSTPSSVNVGMNFTPMASKNYEVEVQYMVRSPTLETAGPRPGINWSSGIISGAAYIQSPTLQTVTYTNCNIADNCISPIGGLDDTGNSYLGIMRAIFQTNTSASGKFEVTLASETNGTDVMMMKGSFLKYRTY